jgi:hypothetical protein
VGRVQAAFGGGDADPAPGTGIISAAFGSPCTAGNWIIAIGRNGSVADVWDGVPEDLLGTIYTPAVEQDGDSPGLTQMNIWYGKLTSSGNNTVSNAAFGRNYIWLAAIEVSGLVPTSPLNAADKANSAGGTTDLTGAPITTTQPNTYVVVGVSQPAFATYTAGAGFTLVNGSIPTNPNNFGGVEDLIATGVLSSVTPHFTSTDGGDGWAMVWAAFTMAAPTLPFISRLGAMRIR